MIPKKIFAPFSLFDIELKNRIVMAPLTRCRAGDFDAPTALNALYYQQRASAGLIISEASQISPQGKGYMNTPGIYSEEQATGWKLVTDAVHQMNGKIFCQLWHVGRISHPFLQENGALPVAPSAICPEGFAMTPRGKQAFVTPRALDKNDIADIIKDYQHSAMIAKKAGFDGIEIHAANGYLLDQFMHTGSNVRTDHYGGNVMNRIRLTLEVVEAVLKVWESHQVGIRISPTSDVNSMFDKNPIETFTTLIAKLNAFHLGYLHCIEGKTRVNRDSHGLDFKALRKSFNGKYIGNNQYTLALAENAIENGDADLISFGRPFIANYDLVHRFKENLPLNEAPIETWYGGGEKGYTDWSCA